MNPADSPIKSVARPTQKGRSGLPRLFNALGYSWAGLCSAWRKEAAFREELMLVIVLAPVAILAGPSRIEIALLLGSLFLIVIVELLNSAVEAAIDRISDEQHVLSKAAKDMGSAAVLLSLLNAVVIWACIFWP